MKRVLFVFFFFMFFIALVAADTVEWKVVEFAPNLPPFCIWSEFREIGLGYDGSRTIVLDSDANDLRGSEGVFHSDTVATIPANYAPYLYTRDNFNHESRWSGTPVELFHFGPHPIEHGIKETRTVTDTDFTLSPVYEVDLYNWDSVNLFSSCKSVIRYAFSGASEPASVCSDDIDNDGDGLIDALELATPGTPPPQVYSFNCDEQMDLLADAGYSHSTFPDTCIDGDDVVSGQKACEAAGYMFENFTVTFPGGTCGIIVPTTHYVWDPLLSDFNPTACHWPPGGGCHSGFPRCPQWDLYCSTPGTAVTECNDGVDNDGDGNIDLADGGCISELDMSEVPHDPQCSSPDDDSEGGNVCIDGVDNDGDGLIDGADGACSGGMSECDNGVLFHLYQPNNSHVGLPGIHNQYPYEVCGESTACVNNTNALVWLSDVNNTHVSLTEDATYTIPVCSDTCIVTTGSCSGTIVASLYESTNSHVALGDFPLYPYKVCCGVTPSMNYWSYLDGTPIPHGSYIERGDYVRLVPTGNAPYRIFNTGGDIVTTTLDYIQASYVHDNLNFSFAGDTQFSTNLISVDPVSKDDPLNVTILSPPCGSTYNYDETFTFDMIVEDPDDIVTGNITINGVLVQTFTNLDGTRVTFDHTLSGPGNVPIVVSANTTRPQQYQKTINLMVYDSFNTAAQEYVAACISSPDNFATFAKPVVDFNASTTRGLIYRGTGTANPGTDFTFIPADDILFDWTFVYANDQEAKCSGIGSEPCPGDITPGATKHIFRKVFPTVNENYVYLTVSM